MYLGKCRTIFCRTAKFVVSVTIALAPIPPELLYSNNEKDLMRRQVRDGEREIDHQSHVLLRRSATYPIKNLS